MIGKCIPFHSSEITLKILLGTYIEFYLSIGQVSAKSCGFQKAAQYSLKLRPYGSLQTGHSHWQIIFLYYESRHPAGVTRKLRKPCVLWQFFQSLYQWALIFLHSSNLWTFLKIFNSFLIDTIWRYDIKLGYFILHTSFHWVFKT